MALFIFSEYWPPSIGTSIGTIMFIVACVLGYLYLKSASGKQTLSLEFERANSLDRVLKSVRDELAQAERDRDRYKSGEEAAATELKGLYLIDVKELTNAYKMTEEIRILTGRVEYLRGEVIRLQAQEDIHTTAERMPPNERKA